MELLNVVFAIIINCQCMPHLKAQGKLASVGGRYHYTTVHGYLFVYLLMIFHRRCMQRTLYRTVQNWRHNKATLTAPIATLSFTGAETLNLMKTQT